MRSFTDWKTGKKFGIETDAIGIYFFVDVWKMYILSIALTDGLATTVAAGTRVTTTHATGQNQYFVSTTQGVGRVWKLDRAGAMNWRGAWDADAHYYAGDVVSDAGDPYIATAYNTATQPPAAGWVLMVTGV